MKKSSVLLMVFLSFSSLSGHAASDKDKALAAAKYLKVCGGPSTLAVVGTIFNLFPILSGFPILIDEEEVRNLRKNTVQMDEVTSLTSSITSTLLGIPISIIATQAMNGSRLALIGMNDYVEKVKSSLSKNEWVDKPEVEEAKAKIMAASKESFDISTTQLVLPIDQLVLRDDSRCAKARIDLLDTYMGDAQMLSENENLNVNKTFISNHHLSDKTSFKATLPTIAAGEASL